MMSEHAQRCFDRYHQNLALAVEIESRSPTIAAGVVLYVFMPRCI
jgi:hypothetical protein